MKIPYLIQRLKKPFHFEDKESVMAKMQNAFSFGGGKPNGGISKEAMKILNEIWRYDYMGSSEFEWGAVPESLQYITKHISDYVTGQFEGKYKSYSYASEKDIYGTASIYYVCEKKDEEDVVKWIKKPNSHLKEHLGLQESVCNVRGSGDTVGWHDIDNHFLFFTDKEMFEKFCMLFEIKTA